MDRLKIISLDNSIPHRHDQKLPRLAASHYLNSAPLIWSFIRGSRINTAELIDAVPARCGQMLSNGQVDGALIPVIEYQRIPAIMLAPDVCVGSKGNVRSVVLVTRKDELKDVRSVALDHSSRTSVTLLKVVFREFLNIEPKWVSSAPDVDRMLSENDAALIIGDPAMTFTRNDLRVFDMASLWREFTGHGFAFAMWAMRADRAELFGQIDFAAARDEGLARVEEIISHHEKEIRLSRKELRAYLMQNITYRIDVSIEEGLKLYFDLAHRHGLIRQIRPLRFLPMID
ncbi:MAG TPA: menaquinone biosynthesis protein [Pyrinomonadaceae bacterium]|nr:menaquinone biosynthesis protein [Pyrinomonadaceae bacterium]